jgi:hypothetical protein
MLKIEFLYYNKTTCERCASTEKSLKELKKTGIKFTEKRLTKEKIHISPTILINGKDIEKILNKRTRKKANLCKDCCQLAGKKVNCRTFTYKGKSYDYIPKQMILEAVKIASHS